MKTYLKKFEIKQVFSKHLAKSFLNIHSYVIEQEPLKGEEFGEITDMFSLLPIPNKDKKVC